MKLLIADQFSFSCRDKEERLCTAVDLNMIAHEALQGLEITIQEKQAEIKLEQLPIVEGNTLLLRQFFENLLSNSLKYTEENTVPHISVSALISGNTAEITFADNGIGFDEKHLARMFSLFQWRHPFDKYGGTGNGLAPCKKIADLHHGQTTAASSPGNTKFIVHLPVKQTPLTQ